MWEDLASHYQSLALQTMSILKGPEWLGRLFILEIKLMLNNENLHAPYIGRQDC